VVALVLLLQGAMPTAQNLVVLLNLDEKVRVQAGLCDGIADDVLLGVGA
jgi:predicted permease